jgi:hypothetical protein
MAQGPSNNPSGVWTYSELAKQVFLRDRQVHGCCLLVVTVSDGGEPVSHPRAQRRAAGDDRQAVGC